jgi:hypothetical protein
MNWQRLGQAVVERRVERGFKTRDAFAKASSLSLRLLGDIENARRSNYDRVTIATLETALGWPAGMVSLIINEDTDRPPATTSELPWVAYELAALLAPDSPITDQDRSRLHAIVSLLVDTYRSR